MDMLDLEIAILQTKNNKSPGYDEIYIDMIKAVGPTGDTVGISGFEENLDRKQNTKGLVQRNKTLYQFTRETGNSVETKENWQKNYMRSEKEG
jgi:hypothetical protein